MQRLLYWVARLLVACLQALPLKAAAILGRAGGGMAWLIDKRHRIVMLNNLRASFPEKSEEEIEAIARENMRRIGESYAAAIKTSTFNTAQVLQICEINGEEKLDSFVGKNAPKNCVVAIGHFANFELNAILGKLVKGLSPATTYRGLREPLMNDLLQRLRARSGCRFYERRTESKQLIEALSKGGILLGLLSDQHAGRGGVVVPFFGRACSTTAAPAIFALRYDAPLHTAICYRTGLGKWRIEVGDKIPIRINEAPRSVEEITTDINRAFEVGIRRDPANWFWVHKRWKV